MLKVLIMAAAMAANMALAATPDVARTEINHLLGAVEKSQCKFNRNGTWYDAKKAREHLEKKFAYMDRKNLVATTEVFIEKGASSSRSSGKPYQMQCQGKSPITSAVWLSEELTRYRKK